MSINLDKKMIIRMPSALMDKFHEECTKEYKTMSDKIRDLVKEYLKEQNA